MFNRIKSIFRSRIPPKQTVKARFDAAQLDERFYREKIWSHRQLTDFWRVGKGSACKLEAAGKYTMGNVAWMSVRNKDLLYRMFGVNAELLIDHAWGWVPCTIADIKSYKPENNSISSGQVLQAPLEILCAYQQNKLKIWHAFCLYVGEHNFYQHGGII